jgi:hypothetical protein
MTIQFLLSVYCVGSTVILIFLSLQFRQFRTWYRTLLLQPEAPLRVQRFFIELDPVLHHFYPLLDRLKCPRGRPATDYRFQFRWLLWWKFFGPRVLQHAIRVFNHSSLLHTVLRAPTHPYSREIFHGFRKKLGPDVLEHLQALVLQDFTRQGLLSWRLLIVDSFPVKSFLNTVKCLKIPPINYDHLTQFLTTISVQSVLRRLESSSRTRVKLHTKLVALLVKNIWDLPSWEHCWKVLYRGPAKEQALRVLSAYKSALSLKSIEPLLAQRPDRVELERLLVQAARQALAQLQLKPTTWQPTTLRELNGCWHTPHRWRDPGSSLYYCAAKHRYEFGRGGLLAILPELELPLRVALTPKYKQSEESILKYFTQLQRSYGAHLRGVKVLGDSEFGLVSIRQAIQEQFQGTTRFPNYGRSKEVVEISKTERGQRKMIERVIGRLNETWRIETPRHLGADYARFHLQVGVLCDQLQVVFNRQLGNKTHPHALKAIRG